MSRLEDINVGSFVRGLVSNDIDLIREQNIDVMKRGVVFIDEEDCGTYARLLFTIEDAIQDGIILPNGDKRVISQNIHPVELKEDGTASLRFIEVKGRASVYE